MDQPTTINMARIQKLCDVAIAGGKSTDAEIAMAVRDGLNIVGEAVLALIQMSGSLSSIAKSMEKLGSTVSAGEIDVNIARDSR